MALCILLMDFPLINLLVWSISGVWVKYVCQTLFNLTSFYFIIMCISKTILEINAQIAVSAIWILLPFILLYQYELNICSAPVKTNNSLPKLCNNSIPSTVLKMTIILYIPRPSNTKRPALLLNICGCFDNNFLFVLFWLTLKPKVTYYSGIKSSFWPTLFICAPEAQMLCPFGRDWCPS